MNLPRFLRKPSPRPPAPDLDLMVVDRPHHPIEHRERQAALSDISRIVACDITGLAAIEFAPDIAENAATPDDLANTELDALIVGDPAAGHPTMPSGPARPIWDINHVLAYGQSFSNGWDGWPILSDTPRNDSLMLGHSVRGADPYSSAWHPIAEPVFSPLAATVQILEASSNDAALPVVALGETVLETALNLWRARMLDGGHARLGHRRLLASSCGVGGQPLEALSKGSLAGYFGRLSSCAESGRGTAEALGLSYGVTALLMLQGEANSWGGVNITSDRVAFKRMMRQFRDDFMSDVVRQIAGQERQPAVFMYQTAGAYANECVSIAQAQLELALEDPGFIMVAPAYGITGTPSGHLDANGYRWLGAHFGRVMHRVLDKGETWRPLHPVHVASSGGELSIAFHVPHPPLVWGQPIPGQTDFEIPDRGFTVTDADGLIPIHTVALAGPVCVRITLSRPPGLRAELRYAAKRTYGLGSLCDSDPEVADCLYTFDPAQSGFQADLPDFIGKPYKLTNWCVGFAMPVAPG